MYTVATTADNQNTSFMTAVPASYFVSLRFVVQNSSVYIPCPCYEFLMSVQFRGFLENSKKYPAGIAFSSLVS